LKRLAIVLILLACVPALMLGAQTGQAAPAKKPAATKAPAEKAPGTAKKAEAAKQEEKVVTTPSGLKYVDVKEGTGPQPKAGDTVVVKYIGTFESGKVFDQNQQGFEFKLAKGEVIKGWDEGVGSMKVGGRRKLIIPPKLGYGEKGYPGAIPPNSTLLFDVTLLSIK
jgi:peptidylprolyl isomerase